MPISHALLLADFLQVLSRALRNRFVELHFSEIPAAELKVILQQRCAIPSSYASKMVDAMVELQVGSCLYEVYVVKQG